MQQRLDGQTVAVEAEACNSAFADGSDKGLLAELLAGEDVADVDLDHRDADGGDSIADSHAGVGVAPGVEDDAIERGCSLLQLVYYLTLDIALVVGQIDVLVGSTQFRKELVESICSIDIGLPPTLQVKIRPVDNKQFLFHGAKVLKKSNTIITRAFGGVSVVII